ncbi:nuclear transcription factor Y subunit A-9-like isoform X1 [Primulina huaijiensis]|uniref:nuclear transcription factor Y subunit A-9-like isoform X1 n=2 Tax=Primulina huaijiensis TaxID=1492673 RepID=UPI003CC72BD9
MEKISSQDHSASSDSVHDENYGRQINYMKPALSLCDPNFSTNASLVDINQSMIPYCYPDPYVGGFFTAYNPHTMIQQHVRGATSGRVPLPVNLPEDGPIYVNAKQYNGILRRRQIRAKLEAQNKLVKTRKPYLHESRHVHALNRVRGSGGRFLSTKKPQQSNIHSTPSSQNAQDSLHFNQNEEFLTGDTRLFEASKRNLPPISDRTSISQAESPFSNIPSHLPVSIQGGGGSGLVYNGNRHYASIVP